MSWRNILLTGTTGFIGSELRPRLEDRGYRVYSLLRYVTGRLDSEIPETVWFSDLRDGERITRIIQKIQPDIVIHLGAITPVSYSYQNPIEVLDTNFMGTVNLAEACRRFIPNFQQFIFASSAEVYGLCKQKLKEESNPRLFPNSPYAVSKLASEKYLLYMREAYNFPTTIFRIFNSYGRKHDKHFVVEKCIYQMLHNEVCRLGDPEPVRDFLHYSDQIEAYLSALENPKAIGETFNVCSGVQTMILDLAIMVEKLTNFKGEVKWRTMPRRPLDIMHLVGSNEKIRRVLGVRKPMSLEDGMRETIEWWRKCAKDSHR